MATIIKRNEPFTPSNASVSVNYSFANTRPMISSQNVNRPQQPTPYYNTNRVNIAPSTSLSTSSSSSSSATASKNELQFLHKSQEMALKYETG